MAHTISESGYIGTDGKMRMPMERLRQFSEANKGKRIVARFEAVEPGTSECQLAYYYNYVIPTIRQALAETGERKTEKQVDKWLRDQCPEIFEKVIPGYVEEKPTVKLDLNTGEIVKTRTEYIGYIEIKEIRDLSVSEMSDYLEWLKQFAAENLYVYIDDPKVI